MSEKGRSTIRLAVGDPGIAIGAFSGMKIWPPREDRYKRREQHERDGEKDKFGRAAVFQPISASWLVRAVMPGTAS